MRTKLALLATTALAAMAIATPAEAAGSGWYLSLTGGGNWLNDNSFATTGPVAGPAQDTFFLDTESDTGYVIAGAVGLSLGNIVQGLRLEAEVAYRQNQVDGLWSSDTLVAVGFSSGTVDYDHTSLSVLANVWYDFDVMGFKPYVGGGLGWADVEADGAYAGDVVRSFSYSADGFAWQLGAGVNFQVAPNMQLGVGYRYFSAEDVVIGAPDTTNNSLTGTLDDDSHSAVVTLTFGG